MYTVLKNAQIVISLLKEYGIKHLVLSPGSRNVPFVHSVENDPYFTCYSVVDERSAAYFALGISEELGVPVLISCTSSTACSNYLPAIKEAYDRGVELIALTADRDPYYREQMENQMIIQPNMFGKYCKKSVDLPSVNNEKDAEYCTRLVNEALLELNHHGKGPVQINFPAFTNFYDFSVKKLPKCRVISRIDEDSSDILWQNKISELKKYRKIMFLFGESNGYSDDILKLLNNIFSKYNCMMSTEHMSNVHCDGTIRTFMVTESISEDELSEIIPEIVITLGGNFASELKNLLRNNYKNIRHWRVSQQGDVVDTFMALDTIFECSDKIFFESLIKFANTNMENDLLYYNTWNKKISNVIFPDLGFTNFFAISEFIKRIPVNSMLHLSILNSVRLSQFFYLDKSIRTYSNLGAYGIDGSLSTFLGQAQGTSELAFLIVGDLSFFYDISAILMPIVNSNVRILLINNHGGGEFQFAYKDAGFQDLNQHIAAGHQSDAFALIKNLPIKYLSANNKTELEEGMKEFVINNSGLPIIFEVFTDINKDAEILNKFYNMNRRYKKNTIIKNISKNVLRKGLRYVKRVFN